MYMHHALNIFFILILKSHKKKINKIVPNHQNILFLFCVNCVCFLYRYRDYITYVKTFNLFLYSFLDIYSL